MTALVGAALVLGACSLVGSPAGPLAPAPAPTLAPSPTPGPSPMPTLVPTAPVESPPAPTPVPTREPLADRPVEGNLHPFTPTGWSGPLVANSQRTGRTHGAVDAAGPVYLSWAYHNTGPEAITQRFHVHVYLNDVFVESWVSNRADTRGYQLVEGWSGLTERVRLTPGTHSLRLVLDPLGAVAETDETDNTYEVELVVTGDAPPAAPSRAPDLAFVTPRDWDGPVVLNSYADRTHDGPLSADVTTHLRYAFKNQGPASVLGPVPVHVYLDGVMVREQVWDSILAGQTIQDGPWDALQDTVRLTPGEYTLRVVLDPGNRILESNTSNNVFERTFTWKAGPVATPAVLPIEPAPTPPPVVTKPDLVPHWRYGWDGPLTVSNATGRFTNDPLLVGQQPYVSMAVSNQSTHAAGPFSVDLYFNGEKVRTERFRNGLEGGRITWIADWDGLLNAASPQVGLHTLRMVIDPLNEVEEWSKDNNVHEVVVRWHSSPPPTPAPRSYTQAQLRSMLSGLPQLLDDQRPVLGRNGTGRTDTLITMAEAGYYLMTGESFLDERQVILLLDRDDYRAWIDETFEARFAGSPVFQHADLLAERERFKTQVLGMMTRHQGVATLVVDAERPFADVLNTLVHEMGHARQDFLNPAQSESGGSLYVKGVQEAQAQQFERAYWLHVSELLGQPLLSYPRHRAYESLIDAHFDAWHARRSTDEHDLGHLLAWTAALADVSVSHLGQALIDNNQLTGAQALELYHHLVDLHPSIIDEYVEARFPLISEALPTMKTLAKRRLIDTMEPAMEGSQHLRVPGLMMP